MPTAKDAPQDALGTARRTTGGGGGETQTGSLYAADMEYEKQEEKHHDGSNQKCHKRAVFQSTDDIIAIIC